LGEAVACRAMARVAAARNDFAVSQRWLRQAETSAGLRASPRETALNQLVRGELLYRQGDAELAHQTVAEAAAKLQALNMHWHAEQATRVLETSRLHRRY
jgi:hypothetical protein